MTHADEHKRSTPAGGGVRPRYQTVQSAGLQEGDMPSANGWAARKDAERAEERRKFNERREDFQRDSEMKAKAHRDRMDRLDREHQARLATIESNAERLFDTVVVSVFTLLGVWPPVWTQPAALEGNRAKRCHPLLAPRRVSRGG